jgi:uncharacterized protein (TIGR03083 family)
MDYPGHFEREVADFEAAVRSASGAAAAPPVPSCPGWTVTYLTLHLGFVHRLVGQTIADRLTVRPDVSGPPWTDPDWLGLPPDQAGWLRERSAPGGLPVPDGLADWFGAGAAELAARFRQTDPGERVWAWGPDQSVGFWQRMQAIEAAIHRWDAQAAIGAAQPVDRELAADAVGQTFEVMAPMRRAVHQAPPGRGERYLFTATDGPGEWAIRAGAGGIEPASPDSGWDLRLAGTASDLMLFLWGRAGPDALHLSGDPALVGRYFELVPPV